MGTTETKGTSIAVLAPYLPYGIECEYLLSTGKPFRRTITGLNIEDDWVTLSNGTCVDFDKCRPVLLSFDDLNLPLGNGVVPAEKVLEILEIPLRAGERLHINDNTLWMSVPGLVKGVWTLGRFMAPEIPLDVADYLRSQHFAVGLEPHQYIRKAAAPATRATRGEVGHAL